MAEGKGLVLPLSGLGRGDVPNSGGKAANLGEMIRAGLPVPPGFVVQADAYRCFVEENGLQPEIERALRGVLPDSLPSLEQASSEIGRFFAVSPLPPSVSEAIRAAYAGLGGVVAVRSSATAEDLPEASFAGQQESFLGIEGDEALFEAVRRCWGSLWSPRAIAYRLKQGLHFPDLALAVIVQRMAPAERSGVLFTAHPVDGRRDRMVIDAGRGENVVEGTAEPEHWELAAGGLSLVAPADPSLKPEQLAQLAEMGHRIARLFGSPQDIEWSWGDQHFHILQARPITTLFPIPEPADDPEAGLRLYLSINLATQGLVEPFTPMGLFFLRSMVVRFAHHWLRVNSDSCKVALGRLYFDLTDLLQDPRWGRLLLRRLDSKDAESGRILRSLLSRPDARFARRPLRFPWLRLSAAVLEALPDLGQAFLRPEAAAKRLVSEADASLRALEAQASRLEGDDRLVFVEETLPSACIFGLMRQLPIVWLGIVAAFLAGELASRWLDPGALKPILRSLPHNPTTEMGRALWRLAGSLQAEGTGLDPELQRFLGEYGHRAVREIDLGVPRWSEDPSYVLELLALYQQGQQDLEQRFRAGAAEAERAARELVERVRRKQGRLAAAWMKHLLRCVRGILGLRERPKFDWVRRIALGRRVLLQYGEELVARGVLERPDDIFFLVGEDLRTRGEVKSLVRRNRERHRHELGRKLVPRLVTNQGETFYHASPRETEGALVGVAVSPGLYEGRVRVLERPEAGGLRPGEVLVTVSVDPGWTPLFLAAGALVMEVGGVISHGSVVAREYGLPAVVGIPGITRRLKTGDRVRVDGEAGLVFLLSEEG